MRFVTWNIHSARGLDGRVSPVRIAEVLAEFAPDVVALNEARATLADGRQARTIARLLGMEAMFQRCLARPGFAFGNAVLTSGRLLAYRHVPLPGQAEPRGLALARIEMGGSRFVFGATHLGLSQAERAEQLAAIVRALPEDEPVVVAGDFNAPASELGPLAERLGVVASVPSFPARSERSAIDLVLASSHWRAGQPFTVETLASDHLPVVVDLELAGD